MAVVVVVFNRIKVDESQSFFYIIIWNKGLIMDILKCMGLLAASIMVFVIAGGGADLHKDRSTYVEKTYEKSELINTGKVLVEMHTIIDDGITKRTVNVNSVVDTLTEEVTTQLGKTFTIMSVESAKERQKEIDRTKDYYKHLRIKTEQIL